MVINTNNYADFVTIVNDLASKAKFLNAVYFADTSARIAVYVIMPAGIIIWEGEAGSLPSTFNADFPTASALQARLRVMA